MSFLIKFTENAIKDIEKLKKSGDKKVLKKLEHFYLELQEHPRSGTGQVEILKYFDEETFSRRLNREHRIVYQVFDETVIVLVLSACGHY